MKKIILIFVYSFMFSAMFAQNIKHLSLYEVIDIAQKQSLASFKAKNMYLVNYWDYRYFKASKLPELSLTINPIEYSKTMTNRYDFEQNIEVFREQKTINTYAKLSLIQDIPYTGGTFFINSDVSRLMNFGDTSVINYNATLVSMGLIQPIFGFNKQKWDSKISPLKYEISKQKYIENMQLIKLEAVELYFSLLMAYTKYETAIQNILTADTLYKIGLKKYDILSVQYQDLLELEQNKYNAEIEKIKAEQYIQKANFNLNSFLNFEKNTIIRVIKPDIISGLNIDADKLVEIAKKNNPKIYELEITKLETEKQYEQIIKEGRFNANIIAGYGLNQYSENFIDTYKNPLAQEIVMLNLNIPIIDWGKNKGAKQIALNKKKLTEIETKQLIQNFEQQIFIKVLEFNIQEKIVKNALKALKLSEKTYIIIQKRYKMGEIDIFRLNESAKNNKIIKENYVNEVFLFWKKYYELQLFSLYNIETNTDISVEFDKLILE